MALSDEIVKLAIAKKMQESQQPDSLDRLMETASQIPDKIQNFQKIKQDIIKQRLENAKLSQEQMPVAKAVGVPAPAELQATAEQRTAGRNVPSLTPDEESELTYLNDKLKEISRVGTSQNAPAMAGDYSSGQMKLLQARRDALNEKKTYSDIQRQGLDFTSKPTPVLGREGVSVPEADTLTMLGKERSEKLAPYGGESVAKVPIAEAQKLATTEYMRTGIPLRGAQTELAKAGVPLKEAQTQKILKGEKTIGDVMPTMADEQIVQRFGEGITKGTPINVALRLGKYMMDSQRRERMFPLTALSPEAQQSARAAGMPEYVPESTARILTQGNPVRFPSAEETTGQATARSIENKFNDVYNAPDIIDDAVGVDKYYINKLGMYTPFVESDPATVKFYTNIQSINNAMIYYMSGKQINEQEYARIMNELLDPTLQPSAFKARMEQAKSNFEFLRTLKDKAISGTGKRDPFSDEVPKPTPKKTEKKAEYEGGITAPANLQNGVPKGSKLMKDASGRMAWVLNGKVIKVVK